MFMQSRFLPEGVGPTADVLHRVVSGIFRDFSCCMAAIFDNLLVLAKDYTDCFNKLKLGISRCQERNVKLKMAKSFIVATKALYFYYESGFYW